MIEGLKVTVAGTELKTLCEKRAEHHRERAHVYRAQKASMEKNVIGSMQYSGVDPIRAIGDKLESHEANGDEMDFIAAHLVAGEQYLLDSSALSKLGISRRGF